MIRISNKSDCCGCGGCSNICPQQCIEMAADNEGFLYPKIDGNACINCDLCEKVCPQLNVEPDETKEQWGYVVQNKDEKILEESTSGGAFTAIAEYVIDNGGIVYGAAYDNEFNVIHTSVDNKEDLYRFRNSKYVQSNTGECYKEVKDHLDKGRLVCFSGTPCQVEGLYHFLGRKHKNLILVDVVCRAVPSPLLWKKYLNLKKRQYNNEIVYIKFRDKKNYGYQYSQFSIYDKNKQIYNNGIESDPYLRAFFSNICDRPSCYNCKFKKRYRVSDFTIWDCFEIYKFNKELDVNKGVTKILIQSQKAQDIFEIKKNDFFYSEVNCDDLIKGVRELLCSVEVNNKRDAFFSDLNTIETEKLLKIYFPDNIGVRLKKTTRKFLIKLGIHNEVKKFVKVISNKGN